MPEKYTTLTRYIPLFMQNRDMPDLKAGPVWKQYMETMYKFAVLDPVIQASADVSIDVADWAVADLSDLDLESLLVANWLLVRADYWHDGDGVLLRFMEGNGILLRYLQALKDRDMYDAGKIVAKLSYTKGMSLAGQPVTYTLDLGNHQALKLAPEFYPAPVIVNLPDLKFRIITERLAEIRPEYWVGGNYTSDFEICDGPNWEVVLEYTDGTAETMTGDVKQPPKFDQFQELFDEQYLFEGDDYPLGDGGGFFGGL